MEAIANRKAFGPDGLPTELRKILADEGDSDNPDRLMRSRRRCVEWRGGDATMERCDGV